MKKALKIDLSHDGIDSCHPGSSLWLAESAQKVGRMGKSVRMGLTYEADRVLRFYERGNAYVSGPARLLRT